MYCVSYVYCVKIIVLSFTTFTILSVLLMTGTLPIKHLILSVHQYPSQTKPATLAHSEMNDSIRSHIPISQLKNVGSLDFSNGSFLN